MAKLKPFGYFLIVLLLGLVFYQVSLKTIHPVEFPNRDFFTFWLAGHIASLGQNPYIAEIWVGGHDLFGATWIPNLTFIYPLPLSLIFLPFGLLPLYQAFVFWDVLTQLMICFSIILLLRLESKIQIKHAVFLLMIGLILARPTVTTLVNGQITGFLLLIISGVIYLWQNEKWWQGATLLPLLALKPNLGGPIIFFLLIYLIRRKAVTSLIASGISGLFLLLVGIIQNSRWIIEFWGAGANKLSTDFGFSPTVWGVSSILCEYDLNCAIAFGSGFTVLFIGTMIYLLMRKTQDLSPMIVVSLSTTIMLLITPYTWTYDQLLLIAPIMVLALISRERTRFLQTAFRLLFLIILALVLIWVTAITQSEIWNVALPVFVLGFLIGYVFKDRNRLAAMNLS